MRADIIGVALTQVGYYEGANNDTKYGVWYGYNNLGWCGMFVSWCAEQAGIPKSIIPKTGSADPQYFGLTARSGKEYRPQGGDLFFRKDSYGNYAHVGIVYYLEGDYFYTIEGNTYYAGPEGVYIRQRKISDFFFGVPNYTNSAEHNYQSAYETAHPHREYFKCNHCGDQYYSGKTTTRSDCADCVTASCSHSFSGWSTAGSAQHQRSCSKCGKKETGNHSWNNGEITKEATCSSNGEKTQTCSVCAATKTTILPALTTHNWGSWEYLNETQHERRCLGCRKTDTKNHTLQADWLTDEVCHWQTCADCEGQIAADVHNYGTECEAPCEVCGYLREDGHTYSTSWSSDSRSHWHICELCQIKTEVTAHTFDRDCDSTCDICNYERDITHSFAVCIPDGSNGHKLQCSKCAFQTETQPHTPGAAPTEEQAQSCTLCGIELSPALPHIHKFAATSDNFLFHSSRCSCGAEFSNVLHAWDNGAKECKECGISFQSVIIPVILIGFILLMAIIGIFALFIRWLKRLRYRL